MAMNTYVRFRLQGDLGVHLVRLRLGLRRREQKQHEREFNYDDDELTPEPRGRKDQAVRSKEKAAAWPAGGGCLP